jgi:hypothetical protein
MSILALPAERVTEGILAHEWPVPGQGFRLLWNVFVHGFPRPGLPWTVNWWRLRNCRRLVLPTLRLAIATGLRLPHVHGALWLTVIRRDGQVIPYGLASLRVVTNAGVAYLVDAMQNLVEPESLRYHGIGTGTAAEAVTDTALGSELTTQYSPDNTRATGTLGEAAANVYRTIGTNTVDAAVTITEHGIFSQAAVPGGTLLDRSVFAGIALASGDSLQSTYDLTFNAGG